MSIRGKLTDKPFCLATHAAGSIARNLCKIKGSLLLLLLLFATSSLRAQTSYPVQVNVMVTPPNSVYLTDYYTRGSERLKVQLLLKEVSRPSFPVKLRFRIEGTALRLNSRPGVNLPPFTLQGGVMVEAAGDALAPYLGLNALVAEGADASSFQSKGQRMADGFYKVEVWAEEMGRSVRVSNIATTFISTMLYQSPLITSPTDKAVLPDQGIQNIVFQWMPRHLGASADVTQSTYYKLKLVEVWPTDRDPQEAIRSSKPLYEGMSTSTTFVYGPSQPTLISGRRYALQVQAQDADQRDLFVGQGYSNVVCFTYGEECQIPQGLNVEIKGPNNATAIWNANPKSTGYTFALRKVYGSDTTWKEQPLGVPTYSMDSLVAESSYQVRVAASCGLAKSLWCQPRSFTTPDRPDTKFECGQNPDIPNITDRTLYPNLKDGDRIQAADFKVEVLTASLDKDGYSGSGIARIPFLRNAPAFCAFKGVKINKDLQLYDGSIVLAEDVTVINKKMVDGAVKLGNDVLNSLKDKNPNSTVIVAPVSGTITATSTATSGAGADTFISGGKTTVTVTTSSGQSVTSTPGTNTKVVDDAGNVVAVSQNGVLTKGKHDKDAFGKGVTNSEAATVASDNKLPKVTFALDTSKPYYGYDTSNSQEPWISIETGKSVSVTASITKQQSNIDNSSIRYRTNDGMVVDATDTDTNPAILDVKGLYSNTAIPILAVADTGKVDSLKTAFICGKINTVGYDPEHRRVWLVPVNGAKVDKDAIAKKLNEVYHQAVVEWDVQYDPAIMSLTLTDDEKANLCKDIDVGLVTNYTLGMQAALRKLAQEPEDKNYLLFMVDGKAGDATGFMPLNRSAGFIFMGGQSADAVARTAAHELGHGAFGLEHVGSAQKDANLAATDNLMDYKGGTTLDKSQWDKIHSEYRRITWFQGEDEGKSIKGEGIKEIITGSHLQWNGSFVALAPDGSCVKLPSDVTQVSFIGNAIVPAGALTYFSTKEATYVGTYNPTFSGSLVFGGYCKLLNSKGKTFKDRYEVNGKRDTYASPIGEIPANQMVVVGIPGDCSIDIYQLEYSKLSQKSSDEGAFNYNLFDGIKKIASHLRSVKDDEACLKGVAKDFSDYCKGIFKEDAKDEVTRVVLLMNQMGEKANDYKKFAENDDKSEYFITSKDGLNRLYNALNAYNEKHKNAAKIVNEHCKECPLYPAIGDSYWDSYGRNWVFVEGNRWRDLSGEFCDEAGCNNDWKKGYDVQQVHREFYEAKLECYKSGGEGIHQSINEEFEKNLYRETQYFTVRYLRDRWVNKQVGDSKWNYLIGSAKESYYKMKVSNGDHTYIASAILSATMAASDVFLMEEILVKGIWKVGVKYMIIDGGANYLAKQVFYKAGKSAVALRMAYTLNTAAPEVGKTFFSRELPNTIEVFDNAAGRYIKCNPATGETLLGKVEAAEEKIITFEKFETQPSLVGQSDETIAKRLQLGAESVTSRAGLVSSLKKLVGKASSENILWKNIDQTNIIWSNPNSNVLSTAKSFANETGTSLYDAVLSNGDYLKFDLNDGRILLGNTNGNYHAFAVLNDADLGAFKSSVLNTSDEVFNDKLSQLLSTNADKLKVLSGSVSKQLTIAGKTVTLNSSKVNTMLGRFRPDVANLFNELGSYKNVGLGERKGGINILNKPDYYYDASTWWNVYNKPWLDKAITRGDDIYLATIPTKADDIIKNGKLLGAYAEELNHLAIKKYKPVNITTTEWNNIKSWLGY
jgi:hypothetical protein